MPRDAKPFDGWSLRTSVTVLRSLVRAIAVMSSKLIMRFASPFLRYPRAKCARATKTAILAGRRNFTKESKGPSERSALHLAECLPVRVLLRRLVARVHAGPGRLTADRKAPRIPHAGACQRARASATDAKVRCGGCGLVLCVQHGFRVRRCARSGLVMQW